MARYVDTGWKQVKPGECSVCGYDDGWDCDGRGTIFCDCQRCPDCQEFDGHAASCPSLVELLDELPGEKRFDDFDEPPEFDVAGGL